MKNAAEVLAQQLDDMAAAYELTPAAAVGKERQLCLTLKVGGCTFKLKVIETPGALRARAKRLRQAGRGNGLTDEANGMRRAAEWKPTMSRPKQYSNALAQQFLVDGERENWEAYRDLFDA